MHCFFKNHCFSLAFFSLHAQTTFSSIPPPKTSVHRLHSRFAFRATARGPWLVPWHLGKEHGGCPRRPRCPGVHREAALPSDRRPAFNLTGAQHPGTMKRSFIIRLKSLSAEQFKCGHSRPRSSLPPLSSLLKSNRKILPPQCWCWRRGWSPEKQKRA